MINTLIDPFQSVPSLDHRSGFVAVIGKPAVGKSTLVNGFVGRKVAIVSHKPQTTRRRLFGILTLRRDQGAAHDAQIIFVDTPGIHRPIHKLGETMVQAATRAMPEADVVLFVADVSHLPSEEDRDIARMLSNVQAPILLVLNKMDRLSPDKVEAHTQAYWSLVKYADWMMTTATKGHNCDKLLDLILARLPLGPPYYPPDQITDQSEREIVGELVREQVLHFTRAEVPHAVAVLVEEWEERENDVLYVGATVFVEKESQKAILIGKRGTMLKQIGQAAREQIEAWLERHVYLDLWVQVRKNWRRDEIELRRLGYLEQG